MTTSALSHISSPTTSTPTAEAATLSPNANNNADRFAWATAQLSRLLAEAPSREVADIGAGEVPMRSPTERLGATWRGYDLAPRNDLVTPWDLDEPRPTSAPPAGIALMLEVVEHLRNPWRAMEHVADLVLPGGYLLLTTPNPRWSRSRMHALAFGLPACFTEADLELNHHVFTPWPHVVSRLLSDVGFAVERYETLEGRTQFPGAPFNHRYPARLLLALSNKLLERRDPSACGMAYGMVARKLT
jgi:hypothetical protein